MLDEGFGNEYGVFYNEQDVQQCFLGWGYVWENSDDRISFEEYSARPPDVLPHPCCPATRTVHSPWHSKHRATNRPQPDGRHCWLA